MDRTTIRYVFFLVLFLILFSLYGFYSVLHPPKLYSEATPDKFGLAYEEVTLHPAANVTLKGWFIPAKNPHAPAIILTHGYGGDMGNILPSRLFLHAKYNLLFFDFRYFGKSTGPYSTAGYEEVADLDAAIQYLHKRGIDQIAIWGLSMGAAVALMSAEKHPMIRGVIAEASYARLSILATDYFSIPLLRYPLGWLLRYWAYLYFGHDIDEMTPEKASAVLNLPVLYMHSKTDEVVPYKHGELLAKAAARNPQSRFYIYNNRLHGQLPQDYEKEISHFLESVFK